MKELLLDSSFDEESFEEPAEVNYELNESENAQIQIQVNRIEVRLLCEELSEGLVRYRDERKKLSRRRQQDVAAINTILAEEINFRTKEECMMKIRERLERIKTGWFIFRGNSRLRAILFDILSSHHSTIVRKFRHELVLEKQAHKVISKRYDYIQGEDLLELKQEIAQLRQALEKHTAAAPKSHEKAVMSQSFTARVKGLFAK